MKNNRINLFNVPLKKVPKGECFQNEKFAKRAQGEKSKIPSLPLKRQGQEEMVGFALILIIVAIIILAFVAITLTRPPGDEIESYEVDSFLQALLQHTTDCRDNLEYLSIQKLIFRCGSGEICLDQRDTCEVLNDTLITLVDNIWKIDEEGGYILTITSGEETMLELSKGNSTRDYKTANQPLSRAGGEPMQISFKAYS